MECFIMPWIKIQGCIMGRPYRSFMVVIPWIDIIGSWYI